VVLLNGPVLGTATLVVDGIILTINGVDVTIGALTGESYVFMFADAAGGPQAISSATGPVTAAATAVSNGWFGTAGAAGFAFGIPPPPPVPPTLAPAVRTTGFASANCIAGRGATFIGATPFPRALLAHVATMLFDPRGDGTAGATLRALARFADGSEREFWRARVTFGRDVTGNARVTVSDPLNAIDAGRFSAFTLRDGSQGARLTPAGGIDLAIPLDPAVLAVAPPGFVELKFETQADASVTTSPFDKRTQKRLIDGIRTLVALVDKGLATAEVHGWLRGAAKAIQPPSDLQAVGVAAHLLRQGRAAALDIGRIDLARRINRWLRETTGVAVNLRDLVSPRVFSDGNVSTLTPTPFEIVGDDTRRTADVDVAVEVNGRPADMVAFGVQPSVGDGASHGTLAWAFGTRRREDVVCASCPSDLGLSAGQNQIVVTVSNAATGGVIGAATAVVIVGSPGPPPPASKPVVQLSPRRSPGGARPGRRRARGRGSRPRRAA
jgi:hypothetical protein